MPIELWPMVEALPKQSQEGVLTAWLALDRALRGDAQVAAVVAKHGEAIQRELGPVGSEASRRRVVLWALRHGLKGKDLLAQLVRADPSFADLGTTLDQIVAELDPRTGRGAQGYPRTAALLSCACGAFDDKNEAAALLRFKEAERVRRRPSSKKGPARRTAR